MNEFKVGDKIYFQGDQGKVMKVTYDGNEPLLEVALTNTRVTYLNPSQLDLYPFAKQLNENQQVVLEWLKKEHFDSYIKSVLSNLYFYVNMTAIGDLENKEIQEMVNAYEKLSQEDFAQVLQEFSQWALDQEEE